jgi:hypothetical protein
MTLLSFLRRWWKRLALLTVAVAALGTCVVWDQLLRPRIEVLADPLERFKYGSIGTEKNGFRIPYWIWIALPRVFPEHLPGPGGYASLGFVWEQGHDLPVGLTKVTIGRQPTVGLNCALCHTASVRFDAREAAQVFPCGPNSTFDLQAYFQFLFRCADDPRFTAQNLLAELEPIHEFSWLEEQLYRYLLIPQTRSGLQAFGRQMSWMKSRPRWGRGRIEPFNPPKFDYLRQPEDGSIGTSDNMSIWGLAARGAIGSAMHWDGLAGPGESQLWDVVVSSAIGDSVRPADLPRQQLAELRDWLLGQEAPRYPGVVDEARAEEGRELFSAHCAACHAADGQRTGQVIPVEQIGTDPHRVQMWTAEATQSYHEYGREHVQGELQSLRKTNGYLADLLDGIWLRAPYLHNGSVPTLRDLLDQPAERPSVFWRGCDLYDGQRMGFVSRLEQLPAPFALTTAEQEYQLLGLPEEERKRRTIVPPRLDEAQARVLYTRFDTAERGNSNAGHLYGTQLSAAQKDALVEYMKKL